MAEDVFELAEREIAVMADTIRDMSEERDGIEMNMENEISKWKNRCYEIGAVAAVTFVAVIIKKLFL
jgi:hypothetical protein